MANDVMQVQCFKCQTIYEITSDLAGQIGECTVCDSIFQIPESMAGKENDIYATTPYVEEAQTAPKKQPESQSTASGKPPAAQAEDFSDSPPPPPDALSTHYDVDDPTPTATNTVKLSRTSVGMLPSIEDSFGFATVDQKAGSLASEKAREENGSREPPRDPLKTGVDIQAKLAEHQAARGKTRKWWQFWKWFKRG